MKRGSVALLPASVDGVAKPQQPSGRTITGTGLKKCRPTTLDALSLPSGSAAVLPSGIVDAAIFVMLMEDVFVARMVFGDSSAESVRKMFCLMDRFSEAACMQQSVTLDTTILLLNRDWLASGIRGYLS